ncbi:DEAD/DEAH box helicase [Piscirickettsia litoralis]|uniref:ATP-dependent RNA helicase DeaD n=1 Tax=Piscirickettsia litoralis TaxID=1891921 RepID=A0ABX2ZZ67_9GAMM|nr:DEAD/DEAH box helicase [Piscirickettsia litoralis]ODN41818.1 DEAD/DEAH box helicase [Piscirickettsia litoralis]
MSTTTSFDSLGIAEGILSSLAELGYETPSPIQEQSIPVLLDQQDILAQAQTGTGKTAAFALPILTQLSLKHASPQALILAPTRELAIQIAEAFQRYAKHLPGFHVLPIYGGQEFRSQLRSLKRGVHIVVGTPGRIMDHMRRETLPLESLKTVVLDEADEMLKMGFIDDVKWILQQIPTEHQTALFSATLPPSIKSIANQHLTDPKHIQIKPKTNTVSTIEQSYMITSKHHKLEALTRYLELEEFDAAIIFARTKIATTELAERLEARGYSAAAMNGDMNQASREQVIKRIKNGSIDIVIATDVAARGIDVNRITHVVNFDIPHDPESYVHRIGRTGRAGREGKALLFVSPRERRLLKDLERVTRQSIKAINPPTANEITEKRAESFKEQVISTLNEVDLDYYRTLVESMLTQSESSELDIAAALAFMAQKQKPLQIKKEDPKSLDFESRGDRHEPSQRERRARQGVQPTEHGMSRCRLEVGHRHRVQPSDIVGVLANEGDITRKSIGRIHIFDDYSLVDLSSNVASQVMDLTHKCRVKGHPIQTKAATDKDSQGGSSFGRRSHSRDRDGFKRREGGHGRRRSEHSSRRSNSGGNSRPKRRAS